MIIYNNSHYERKYMKEETRKLIIADFLKEKRELEEDIEKLKNLAHNSEDVKEYFRLKSKLRKSRVCEEISDLPYELELFEFDTFELLEKHFLKDFFNCQHETLITCENNKVGSWRRYFCLDCGSPIATRDKDKLEFEQGKTILYWDIKKLWEYQPVLKQYRREYLNLLVDNSSKESAEILSRKLLK